MLLGFLDQCAADRLPVKAQVCGRPVGLLLGLSLTLNPFSAHASYKKIEHLPFAERLAAMRTPEMRARAARRKNRRPTTRSSKPCCATSQKCSRSPIRRTTSRRPT